MRLDDACALLSIVPTTSNCSRAERALDGGMRCHTRSIEPQTETLLRRRTSRVEGRARRLKLVEK